MTPAKQHHPHRALLAWYDAYGRDLPWRVKGGPADPYRVWLSEIMLQQTTVAAVAPYFEAFTKRWPSIEAFAEAPLDDVLHAWQGLGYYARARNMVKCARVICAEHGGRWPEDARVLVRLPGIGPYTAAAIAAIAFDKPARPIDANIRRVVARFAAIDSEPPALDAAVAEVLSGLMAGSRVGDFVQAMMDLGAGICTPRAPACEDCPWACGCRARHGGDPQAYPRAKPKPPRPMRHGVAFWAQSSDGRVLFRRRPEKGLLGGMMEVPSTEWRAPVWHLDDAMAHAPLPADWQPLAGKVRHAFTHFVLELTVLRGCPAPDAMASPASGWVWSRREEFSRLALPTLMKKVVRHAHEAAPAVEEAQTSAAVAFAPYSS